MKKHWRYWVWILGIGFVTFLVYAQSLGNAFVMWDDGLLIFDNPIIRGFSWSNIVAAFTSYDPELYIPLTFLSYQINYTIGGLEPFGYHLGNLLLHMGNAMFIWCILSSLLNEKLKMNNGTLGQFSIFHFLLEPEPRSRGPFSIPTVCALLFALHPLHTEAVVWAAARKDVLSAFFFLLTVVLYVRSRIEEAIGKDRAPKNGCAGCLSILAIITFFFALLSKASVLTWPLLLLLLDWYADGAFASYPKAMQPHTNVFQPQAPKPHACKRAARYWIGSCKRALPYFVLSLIFGIVALNGKIANAGFLYEKFLIGCRAVTLLLGKFFWPVHLSVLYPFVKPIAFTTPELGLSVLFVFFISVLVCYAALRRNLRLPLFAWGWFLLLLAPSFTTIAKGHNELLDIYITSDRYAYLPSVAGVLFAGWLLMKAADRFPAISYSAVVLVLCAFAFLSHRQSLVWKNTLTLFTHASEVEPNAYVAWTNIGTEYVHQGKLSEGLQAYGKALAIRDDATTWYDVGQILRAQGKIDLAIAAYERAVKSSPLEVDARRALEELKIEN